MSVHTKALIAETTENCPRCGGSNLSESYRYGDRSQVQCGDCDFSWEEECETIGRYENLDGESDMAVERLIGETSNL